MDNEPRFYVYAHYRASDGELFYVGKGSGPRAHSPHGRNKYWHKIVNKHGFNVRIIRDGLRHQCALTVERIVLANNWHPKMANVSMGGDGAPYHTEETRRKISASRKGKCLSKGSIDKIAKALSRPIINSEGEVFSSTREACRILSKRLGKTVSSGAISDVLNGLHAYAYGMRWSFDTTKIPAKPKMRRYRTTLVCVETGQAFQGLTAAKKWLIANGRATASTGYLCDAARYGSSAYGFHWEYSE